MKNEELRRVPVRPPARTCFRAQSLLLQRHLNLQWRMRHHPAYTQPSTSTARGGAGRSRNIQSLDKKASEHASLRGKVLKVLSMVRGAWGSTSSRPRLLTPPARVKRPKLVVAGQNYLMHLLKCNSFAFYNRTSLSFSACRASAKEQIHLVIMYAITCEVHQINTPQH